jgi:hypothetical protein
MDLTQAAAPRSDQLNADDLISGPRTVTIASVRPGSEEQPVNIDLVEFPGRPLRPAKTVLRVLIVAWGTAESDEIVGRRMTLYRDPDVPWGGKKVGGIRVSHLSHIDRAVKLASTVKRGVRKDVVIEPLPEAAPETPPGPTPPANEPPADEPPADTPDFASMTDIDTLRGLWRMSDEWGRAAIEARISELRAVEGGEP